MQKDNKIGWRVGGDGKGEGCVIHLKWMSSVATLRKQITQTGQQCGDQEVRQEDMAVQQGEGGGRQTGHMTIDGFEETYEE
jgi:hypothetical protein